MITFQLGPAPRALAAAALGAASRQFQRKPREGDAELLVPLEKLKAGWYFCLGSSYLRVSLACLWKWRRSNSYYL